MKKVTLLPVLVVLVFASPSNVQENPVQSLSVEAVNSLQARGFNVLGVHHPVRSPRLVDSTNLAETSHIQMSLDLNAAKDIDITWLGSKASKAIAANPNDVILTENYESDFPGSKWRLSGNPTWGKTGYQKYGGQSSVFCAQSGIAGVTPPANYPNNMNAMMVFGPFDLTGASLAFVRFWYWLDTEINKDWFYYMASLDGVNFSGIGVSGFSGWDQTSLNLGGVPELGNLTGKSLVWIAFGFTSDSTGTDRGVFVDDVEVLKSSIGTGLSGYISGTLTSTGNPYIAFDHIGVAQGDTLLILPGTEIKFDQAKELVVQGFLNARGTVSDSLKFTSNSMTPKPGDWVGIGFYSADTNATVQYALIEGARSGIFTDGRLLIANNLIVNSSYSGIECDFDFPGPIIRSNKISSNVLGIRGRTSSALIDGNEIDNNQIGITMTLSSNVVRNNHIHNNSEAVVSNTSDPIIVRNIIENNGSNGVSASGGAGYISSFVCIIGNQILNKKDLESV
jgi:hypothetical protein